jgi:hypothetical protein
MLICCIQGGCRSLVHPATRAIVVPAVEQLRVRTVVPCCLDVSLQISQDGKREVHGHVMGSFALLASLQVNRRRAGALLTVLLFIDR